MAKERMLLSWDWAITTIAGEGLMAHRLESQESIHSKSLEQENGCLL